MHIPRKQYASFCSAILIAFTLITILGCSRQNGNPGDQISKSDPQVKVRLNTPFLAVDFAPFFVAKNKHWFEEFYALHNAAPDYQSPLQSIAASNEALGANRTDLLMTGEIVPVIGRSGGLNVKIVWVSASLDSEIMVAKTSSIQEIKDLRGKKIGLIIGSGPHFCLLNYLKRANLTKNDVQLINLLPPDGKTAFETGSIDAWAIFPPWTEQEIIAGTAKMIPIENPHGQMEGIMAASGEFCDKHSELVVATIQALDRARNWMIKNPEEAQLIVSKEINQPIEVVQMAWSKMSWTATLSDSIVEDIQAKADFLKDEGIIRSTVNVKNDLIYQAR